MRDPKDKQTIPLIPETKKPGRPSTGNALTPAQRKAEQRRRDREKVISENLSDATITALCEQLQRTVSNGDVDLVKGITLELMKRAKAVFKGNVTVTKSSLGAKSKFVTVTKPKLTTEAKASSVTVTKTKAAPSSKSKAVTVTKKKPTSTNASMAKREAELKKMIGQAKPKQPVLI